MASQDSKDKGQMRRGRITIHPGAPIALEELEEINLSDAVLPNELGRQFGKTLKAYLVAAKELLEGRYAHLSAVAPPHMTAACSPKAFVFPDGILVRYDLEPNPELKVLVGRLEDKETLSEWAPKLTESFLHCPENPQNYDPGDDTVKLTLSAISNSGDNKRELGTQRIFATVSAQPKNGNQQTEGLKLPRPWVSIRNEFDLLMQIELLTEDGSDGNQFLTRNRFRIPVGWDAIELYPPYDLEVWNPDIAQIWAENDLLSAMLRRNLRDKEFHEIDPNAQARKQMAKTISDCAKLLEGNEEPLHQYIKDNPILLRPTHDRMWSKLPLGKRVTDFVFRDPSGDYLLVELEKPSKLLFRKDGQQRAELTQAIDQITDWRRYIEDNLSYVQTELGLNGISSNPSCLLVIGRSNSLTAENRRKLVTIENSNPKLKIMTYDKLLETANITAENILGPLWDPGPHTEVYLLPK